MRSLRWNQTKMATRLPASLPLRMLMMSQGLRLVPLSAVLPSARASQSSSPAIRSSCCSAQGLASRNICQKPASASSPTAKSLRALTNQKWHGSGGNEWKQIFIILPACMMAVAAVMKVLPGVRQSASCVSMSPVFHCEVLHCSGDSSRLETHTYITMTQMNLIISQG